MEENVIVNHSIRISLQIDFVTSNKANQKQINKHNGTAYWLLLLDLLFRADQIFASLARVGSAPEELFIEVALHNVRLVDYHSNSKHRML